MKAQSTRVAALLTVAAALTAFAFVVASPPQRPAQIGLTAQAGDVQALDDSTDADAGDADALLQQEEEEEQGQQQSDDEQAQLAQQQAEQDMLQSEQEAEQQNEAAQQQMQLDEQLASQ
jgi:hypothetical protein